MSGRGIGTDGASTGVQWKMDEMLARRCGKESTGGVHTSLFHRRDQRAMTGPDAGSESADPFRVRSDGRVSLDRSVRDDVDREASVSAWAG